ncbi:Uncharacterized secreted protein [Leminorella richardii]|uniref:Uncharacterized secreted protein n=1 Tax=Leminorella richardii TaxID=158841 RepID=A0A2X4V155_9GAMM|nr:spore coat U domain-containing protein [Leminorella richardii]SQI41888.1 Uncharacterized secreted protein [Leminorella richardii]
MKIRSGLVLGLLSALSTLPSFADEVSGTLGVQMTITSGCAINGSGTSGASLGTLDFGTAATLSQAVISEASSSTSGTIHIQCTNQLPYRILVGAGLHDDGTQRRMSNGSEYILYNLYQNAGLSTAWENATEISRTADGTQESLAVYGRVPAQDTPSAAAYTDTVQVTVSW